MYKVIDLYCSSLIIELIPCKLDKYKLNDDAKVLDLLNGFSFVDKLHERI